MRQPVICALILCLTLCSALALAQGSDKEKAAAAAAKEWLVLVDSRHYGQSWKQAAEYFRAAVTREEWRDSLMAVRTPLGQVRSREFHDAAYKTSLPGAPDGEYIVIQFKTSFENKESAVETVTPMLEKDGRWRVSGYFIR
jgi:hypothetical protein